MEQKKLGYILGIESVLSVISVVWLKINMEQGLWAGLNIGQGLRKLSVSSSVGNILAWILFIAIGCIPIAIWFGLRRKGKLIAMDNALFIISPLLFIFVYYSINPKLLSVNVPGTEGMILGGIFYSLVVGYLILRVTQKYASAGVSILEQGMKHILFILAMLFVYVIFGNQLSDLIGSIAKISENKGSTVNLYRNSYMITWIILGLNYMIEVLPYILNILIIFKIINALQLLKENRYSENTVIAVQKLASFCVKALRITVLAEVAFNLIQFILRKQLYNINIEINIPIYSILFVLMVLLFARYMEENLKLKQENDLFI